MITDAAGTDNAQYKHLGQAMCDAFDAYSNKSNVIRDEQMHLTGHETVRTALSGILWINTGVNFNNFSQVMQFACDLLGKCQFFVSLSFLQIFGASCIQKGLLPGENLSKSSSLLGVGKGFKVNMRV